MLDGVRSGVKQSINAKIMVSTTEESATCRPNPQYTLLPSLSSVIGLSKEISEELSISQAIISKLGSTKTRHQC
jgi:hypothetical protein